jgi:2-polyprenyl-3-methyl-5-hydroxy-6-metoxy-1,4-benzoquinol methylase
VVSIKTLLLDLNLISETNVDVFAHKTRDRDNLTVFRDRKTKVIFIDDFFPSDETYKSGDYRNELQTLYGTRDFEIIEDTKRRLKLYKQFYIGKKIVDFGCGEGAFLRQAHSKCLEAIGVEVEKSCVKGLIEDGINCIESLKGLKDNSYDTIFCFHTFEHLSDPLSILEQFKKKLLPGGTLVVEVPHANDFLLNHLESEAFKNFTLWSQHLILHTRASLGGFLRATDFSTFKIQGVQRYNLANHLNWLANGMSGGHKGPLSLIETNELRSAYENSLRMLDATDTIVAVATNI